MLHPQAQSEPDPGGSLFSGHPCPPATSFRCLHFSQASGKDELDFQKGPALLLTSTAKTPIRYKVHGKKSAH